MHQRQLAVPEFGMDRGQEMPRALLVQRCPHCGPMAPGRVGGGQHSIVLILTTTIGFDEVPGRIIESDSKPSVCILDIERWLAHPTSSISIARTLFGVNDALGRRYSSRTPR